MSRRSRAARRLEGQLITGLCWAGGWGVAGVLLGWSWVVFPAFLFGVIPAVQAGVKLYTRRGVDAVQLPQAPSKASREKQIMRLARSKKGRLTPMEVAVDSSFSLAEAEELLDAMATAGHVRMEVDHDGRVHYEFPAFLPESPPS